MTFQSFEQPTVDSELIFDAFASHATDPDGDLVRYVGMLLESFHRRSNLSPKHARQVQLCVDGRNFIFPRRQGDSEPMIEEVVRAYQKKSRSLLVFCGPLSHQHPWIGKEIEWWGKDRPNAPIYFILTHGADPAQHDAIMPASLLARGGPDNAIFFDMRGFYRRGRVREALTQLAGRTKHKDVIRTEVHKWKSVRPLNEEIVKLWARLVSDATGNLISVADLITSYEESERKTRVLRRIARAIITFIVSILIMLLGYATVEVIKEQHRTKIAAWVQQAEALASSPGPQLIDALAFAAGAVADSKEAAPRHALYKVLPKLIPIEQSLQPSIGTFGSAQTQVAALFGKDHWLAIGGRDGVLRLVNAQTGEAAGEVMLNCGRIRIILSSDNDRLLIIGSDQGVYVIATGEAADSVTPKLIAVALEKERIGGIALATDGTLYVGSLKGTLWQFQVDEISVDLPKRPWTGKRILEIMDPRYKEGDVPSSVFGIALRDTRLFIAGIDGVLTVLDVSTAQPKIRFQIVHPASIFALDVSHSGNEIAVADDEGDISIYDGKLESKRVAALKVAEPASVAQLVDGNWMVARPDEVPAVGIAFDSTGTILASSSHDRTIKFLLSSDLKLVGSVVHSAPTRGVVFSRHRPVAYTFADDGIINIVKPLSHSGEIRIGNVESFAVAPDTAYIGYWAKPKNSNNNEVFFIRPGMGQPGQRLGDIQGEAWDGIAIDSNTLLIKADSVIVHAFSLDRAIKEKCASEGLQHPNEPNNVQSVKRLLPGTRPGEIVTVAQSDSHTSYLRLWNAAYCDLQETYSFQGTAEQVATAEGLIGFVERKRLIKLFNPGSSEPADEVEFQNDVSTITIGPRGSRFAAVFANGAGECICEKGKHSSVTVSEVCSVRSQHYVCQPLDPDSRFATTSQVQMSPLGNYLLMIGPHASIALANSERNWSLSEVAPAQVRPIYPPFAFSNDEALLAVPAGDTGIRILDPKTLETKVVIPTPSRVSKLTFLGNGSNQLVSLDGNVLRLWDWRSEKLIRQACDRWPKSVEVSYKVGGFSAMKRSDICTP